jgi:concentrative nucleoside transporter, CNT family
LGVMQVVVRGVAFVMQKSLGTSGPETLAAAANIFVGQTEAPLVVKPYLASMTRSELNALMVGGFATITGSLIAGYASMGVEAGHLITASVISGPAALLIAKLMVPDDEGAVVESSLAIESGSNSVNLIGAAVDGASDGMKLALNIAAMLIAFLALIAMADFALGQAGALFGLVDSSGTPTLTITNILGYAFAPVAWLIGVPWSEAMDGGKLLGIKMFANEFVAYQQLGEMIHREQPISDRTKYLMTYALCGFSNFCSIGIQIGGIGSLAPGRRNDLAQLGFRAMIGGTLACLMTACVAGILL